MGFRPSRVGSALALLLSLAIALLWIRSARVADRIVWKRGALNCVPPDPHSAKSLRLNFTESESETIDVRVDSGFIVIEYFWLSGDWDAHHELFQYHGQHRRNCPLVQ